MKNKELKFLIEKKASEFRQTFGLNDIEAINIKSLLLKLKILVVYRPLSNGFCGLSVKSGQKRFMLINSNDPRGRQHFTIGHELYHLYIEEEPKPHICSLNGSKDMSEIYADAFSQLLLMPKNGVLQMIPYEELKEGYVSMATLLKVEHYFGVSHQAAVHRLADLGLIKAEQKKSLKQISIGRTARKYGYDTSLYDPGNEGLVIGDFGEKAKFLFDQGKISEGHYLELLHKIGINDEED